jgi:hypothetical protein
VNLKIKSVKNSPVSIFNSRRFNYRRRSSIAPPLTHLIPQPIKKVLRPFKKKKDFTNEPLSSALYHLVSELQQFYAANQTIDLLRHQYGNPWHMSPGDKKRFYDSKQIVIEFNHALRRVIATDAPRFDFEELLNFIVDTYTTVTGQENTDDFYHHIRTTLVGMRNEIAVEQMLIAAGISYELGSLKQDAVGGDFIINGVPVDIKASEKTADSARQRAISGGYDPGSIAWSHIDFEDFNGALTLSPQKSREIFAQLEPELKAIVASQKRQY